MICKKKTRCSQVWNSLLANGEVKRMSMTTFIIIVGLVLLTMVIISEAIRLMIWLYEHDRRNKRRENG